MATPKPTKLIHWLAVGFGSGLAPKAPGTFGTLAAVPFYLLLAQLPQPAYMLALLVCCVAGVWICGRSAADFGEHDHPAIVWDEFAGFFITMALVPLNLLNLLLGFALFRLFDIMKPFPIGWLDKRVSGGLGIMLDDIVAGMMSLGGLLLLQNYL